jgi:hypothetical protein
VTSDPRKFRRASSGSKWEFMAKHGGLDQNVLNA